MPAFTGPKLASSVSIASSKPSPSASLLSNVKPASAVSSVCALSESVSIKSGVPSPSVSIGVKPE